MLAGIFTICQGFISKDSYELPIVEARWFMTSVLHSWSGGPGSSPARVLGRGT